MLVSLGAAFNVVVIASAAGGNSLTDTAATASAPAGNRALALPRSHARHDQVGILSRHAERLTFVGRGGDNSGGRDRRFRISSFSSAGGGDYGDH